MTVSTCLHLVSYLQLRHGHWLSIFKVDSSRRGKACAYITWIITVTIGVPAWWTVTTLCMAVMYMAWTTAILMFTKSILLTSIITLKCTNIRNNGNCSFKGLFTPRKSRIFSLLIVGYSLMLFACYLIFLAFITTFTWCDQDLNKVKFRWLLCSWWKLQSIRKVLICIVNCSLLLSALKFLFIQIMNFHFF